MNMRKIWILGLIVALGGFSCKKEENPPVPQTVTETVTMGANYAEDVFYSPRQGIIGILLSVLKPGVLPSLPMLPAVLSFMFIPLTGTGPGETLWIPPGSPGGIHSGIHRKHGKMVLFHAMLPVTPTTDGVNTMRLPMMLSV